ncbi:MAG: MCE family protein [bacterium]|nr:MCE family protein [bacterium]
MPRRRTRMSLVWVVPIVAAIVGVWVAVAKIMGEGPTITIVFDSAEGMEAGKTEIHYNGVTVGTLATLRIAKDHRKVVATARMQPETASFLVEDTHFWVVRPRISGATVSGLGTLISGAYVGMEIGKSTRSERSFVALASPPVVSQDVAGTFFVLRTSQLGSLDYGTPIYFRRLQVGEVASYELDADGRALTVRIFVQAPYDGYVTTATRFWQASGIDVSLTAAGLTVQTQSLLSILVGGIAFEAPPGAAAGAAAPAETTFTLYDDRTQAFQPPRGVSQTYELVFRQSVRGLAVGAPVEFWGIPIGEVVDVRPEVDTTKMALTVHVTVEVHPELLHVTAPSQATPGGVEEHRVRVDGLVAHGMRAQLQTGNLLTGALFVALDFFPDAPQASIDWSLTPPRIPTTAGEIAALEAKITRLVTKLEALPIDAIGKDVTEVLRTLDATLAEARRTLAAADKALADAGTLVAPDSALRVELSGMLQEMSRAMRSLRVLTDYLERHPESLLRGKSGEAK